MVVQQHNGVKVDSCNIVLYVWRVAVKECGSIMLKYLNQHWQ